MITDENIEALRRGEVLSIGEFDALFPRMTDRHFLNSNLTTTINGRDHRAALQSYENLMARMHRAEESLKQAADAAGDLLTEDPPDTDNFFVRVKYVLVCLACPWIRRHALRMTEFVRHYENNLLKHSKYRLRP